MLKIKRGTTLERLQKFFASPYNQELKEGKRQLLHDGITLANEVIKLKRAIEIIKEKAFLKINYSENEKSYHFIGGKSLTNEEVELLKEVLGK